MRTTKNIRAVIFDVDGTLVDSNDAHAHAWVRAFSDWGHPVTFEQVRPLVGMGGDKIIPRLTGLDPHDGDGKMISQRRRDVFAHDFLPLLTPTPGAGELVQMVRARGLRAVVASSAEKSELEPLLKAAGVDHLMEHTVSKDEAGGQSKPDPDAIEAALEFLALPPDEVIMIGDTPYDIEAAAKIGIGTIAVRCGGFSLQDLADAVAVYADPRDLVNDWDASPLARRPAA